MTIKINNVIYSSEVLPVNKPSLDETLETFSFALASSTDSLPFAPMQNVEITTDSNEVINLVLISDSVEPYSMNPLRYKHNITCIESTRELSKHLVRNSVFTQPANPKRESLNAFSFQWSEMTAEGYSYDVFNFQDNYSTRYGERTSTDTNSASIPLHLTSKEKIKNSYIRIESLFAVHEPANPISHIYNAKTDFANIDEIENYFTGITCITYIQLRYVLNGTTRTENISLENLEFNKNIKYDRVIELANLGANDFELIMPSWAFFTGVIDPYNSNYTEFFVFQFKIIADVYYYTAYNILDLLIKRQQKDYELSGISQAKEQLFYLPVSGDLYKLLKNTIAPNFTFTQLTLYECIAEVFRLYDAIFTLDSNKVLGITFFNETNKEQITPTFTGLSLSHSEDKYTNGLISYYQDARINEIYPSSNSFAPLRSREFGVSETQDHNIIVSHNINQVYKVYLAINIITVNVGNNSLTINCNNYPLDISHFVVESSIWSLLDKSSSYDSSNTQTLLQVNSLYFEKGTNYIPVAYSYKTSWNIQHHAIDNVVKCAIARLFGIKNESYLASYASYNIAFTPTNWYAHKFRVEYQTSVDGRTQIESINNKYDGETLIDQTNGAVDLNKMGLNMLGLTLKLGEPTLNATQQITTWSNRIKVGDVFTYQSKLWVANVCSYTLLGNGYIQTKISFVKDFNALSLRTRLLKEKRMSNISNALTQKSEDNIIDYVYYSTSSFIADNYEQTAITLAYVCIGMYLSFVNDENYNLSIDFAMLENNSDQYYLPLIVYGSGNMICFEMSYDSPINVGNQTTYGAVQTWYGANKYYTNYLIYTDVITTNGYEESNGFLDIADISIMTSTNYSYDENFPLINETFTSPQYFMTLYNYKIYKQPNEIFALNYEIAFIPNDKDNDFIGSELINNNFFTNRKPFDRKLYIYYSNSKKYDVLDRKGIGDNTEITSTSVNYTNFYSISFNFAEIPTHISWSICDEDGNILFASNNGSNSASAKTIYFTTRHQRI